MIEEFRKNSGDKVFWSMNEEATPVGLPGRDVVQPFTIHETEEIVKAFGESSILETFVHGRLYGIDGPVV